jgi:SPP1 family predicted phage head-tail adaptor
MIGQKRERVEFMVTQTLRDPGGGTLPSNQVVYWDTYAQVTTIKNQRNAQAYQADLEEPKEFRIRYRPDKNVTKNMLIKHNDLMYTIQSNIDVNQRKRELVIIGMTRK